MQTRRGWIPLKVQNPPEMKEVLVYDTKTKSIRIDFCFSLIDEEEEFVWSGDFYEGTPSISHWAFLPKNPRQ